MINLADFQPDQIIWSAKLPAGKIESVVAMNALPKGTVIKLGSKFFKEHTGDVIDFFQDSDYPVFMDTKFIRLSAESLVVVKSLARLKPYMMSLLVDSESVMEDDDALNLFAEECHRKGVKPCLTTMPGKNLEGYVDKPNKEELFDFIEIAHRAGFTDIICTPSEARSIIGELGKGLDVTISGVRIPKQGPPKPSLLKHKPEKEIITPHEAFEIGAKHIIVGHDLSGDGKGLKDKIGRRYNRLIENIQMDK